ncbi:uncharacterized protein LOC105287068 [Ooceraea biroi]|uniref:uncharacterized protein LOC105287068 n=1 Tax=Ooceraea biroi TaxID=2015173 RepID=UPI0005B9C6B4|nr:uncharacterized protein LOC105287068 [Ooceraea biroi]
MRPRARTVIETVARKGPPRPALSPWIGSDPADRGPFDENERRSTIARTTLERHDPMEFSVETSDASRTLEFQEYFRVLRRGLPETNFAFSGDVSAKRRRLKRSWTFTFLMSSTGAISNEQLLAPFVRLILLCISRHIDRYDNYSQIYSFNWIQ